MPMYQGPLLPPLVVGVEDPVGPHTHPLEAVIGVTSLAVRDEGQTQPHQHVLADVADANLWELVLWTQVYGG